MLGMAVGDGDPHTVWEHARCSTYGGSQPMSRMTISKQLGRLVFHQAQSGAQSSIHMCVASVPRITQDHAESQLTSHHLCRVGVGFEGSSARPDRTRNRSGVSSYIRLCGYRTPSSDPFRTHAATCSKRVWNTAISCSRMRLAPMTGKSVTLYRSTPRHGAHRGG
jgi:hypothetical protein